MESPIIKIQFPMPDNEACAAPYWMIIDPERVSDDREDKSFVASIVNALAGPFFSRDEAKEYLDAQKHNFSAKAVVWSLYGRSRIYQNAWRKADDEHEAAITKVKGE
ncbi:MAG: hypothetical protein LUE17_05910 [Planctomycetaceae bacterium]|nr:hypothetical protein [Planctomycetaceae bacterium]